MKKKDNGPESAPKRLDLSRLKTYPLASRKSKVALGELARPPRKGENLASFLGNLPGLLGAKDLLFLADAIAGAHGGGRSVALAMGAHVIKVGLSPLLVSWIERGVLTSLTLNGAGVVHDFEMAYAGKTSEDVEETLPSGEFGMAEETGRLVNRAVSEGAAGGLGLGEAVGRFIEEEKLSHRKVSLLAACRRAGIPATVHAALGTDIVHLPAEADGAAWGAATHRDFRTFCEVVAGLSGGVYLNVGSAVLLPEIFLKALSLCRNLGEAPDDFVTANLDFQRHYRPTMNVLRRPAALGGRPVEILGHHEILFPLLYGAVEERL